MTKATSTTLPGHRGFVNSVPCDEGTHISSVLDKIVDGITKKVMSKNKTLIERTVRTLIRKSVVVVVKALLPDPTFSGPAHPQHPLTKQA